MVDAREYHEQTKHSPRSVRADTHRLDPRTKPRPYKIYESLPRVEPAGEPEPPGAPALAAIAQADAEPDANLARAGGSAPGPLDLRTLCQYATGVTKELQRRGEPMRFRAASCTGKLYHVDLYAVVGEGAAAVNGPSTDGDAGALDAGVYHFDPHEGVFDVLREGDYRGVLASATGCHDHVVDAPVTFVATSEWWRNAWKYRERTYRHAFWDSGTILGNLLAVAHAAGHRASVATSFADEPVADLLGVDPESEAPLELVPVGSGTAVPEAGPAEPIDPEEVPVSPAREEYPLVPDAWRQSALDDADAAADRRDRAREVDRDAVGRVGPGGGEPVDLEPVDAETASARPIGATIERRGSLREFPHEPVSARTFATVLDRALRGVPTDAGSDAPGRLVDCYCLVNAVENVPQGAYQYHPDAGKLERLGETDRETAGHLALDQPVVGDAAANVYLLADVDRIVEELGNRGYRLAQLEAGVALGRLYLATYAHRALGGRGFTFYDDLVTEHLSPRAAEQTPMTMFAFGRRPG